MSDPLKFTRRKGRLIPDTEIISLYAQRGDSILVGQLAGCSPQTVLELVRQAGGAVRPRGGPAGRRIHLTLPEAEIVRRYREGLHAREIAPLAGCSINVVYRILEEHGVERRQGGPASTHRRGR